MGGELVLIIFITFIAVYVVGWTLLHLLMTRRRANPFRVA